MHNEIYCKTKLNEIYNEIHGKQTLRNVMYNEIYSKS